MQTRGKPADSWDLGAGALKMLYDGRHDAGECRSEYDSGGCVRVWTKIEFWFNLMRDVEMKG